MWQLLSGCYRLCAALIILLPVSLGAQSGVSDGWKLPRMPWGVPDLQGLWTSATLTPLERPASQFGKIELTEAELIELERRSVQQRMEADGKAVPGTVGGYNQVWLDAGTRLTRSRRTSLIIDPPDGRIPWRPDAGIMNELEVARYGVGPFESHLDLDTGERCITDGLPNMVPLQPYNMNMQVFQVKGIIVMLHEMYHEVRLIPITDRALSNIPQWIGVARGRWEGDTLVVETTNFADKTDRFWSAPWRKARTSLRLVERFTRVGNDEIDYTFTLEDPVSFSRSWTAVAPMTTNQESRGVTSGPIWEYACHEGNQAIVNILSGARLEELSSKWE